MRILHIWDIAGVASTIAHYQRKLGHDVYVHLRKSGDPFGISQYYNEVKEQTPSQFYFWLIDNAGEYDIFHVHSTPFHVIPFLKLRYPRKKLIYHLHGGEFSFKVSKKYKLHRDLSILLADKVFVASKDMLKYSRFGKQFVWIPTPVDLEHWKNQNLNKSGSLYVQMHYVDKEASLQFAQSKYPELLDNLTILKRQELRDGKARVLDYIDYKEYPAYLNQFEYFIDVKIINGKLIGAMSRNGLEALACGLKVFNYAGKIETVLPSEHDAKSVASYVCDQYIMS